MASTAITKAIRTLESRQKADFRKKVQKAAADSQLVASGAAVLGGGVAGFIDAKRAEPGEVASWGKTKIPINATAGPAMALTAMFMPKGIIRDGLGGLGVGLSVAASYRLAYDRTEAAEED